MKANAQAKVESGVFRSSLESVTSNMAESFSSLSEQEQKLDNLQQALAELKDDFSGQRSKNFWPSHPPLVVLARGRVVRGPRGWRQLWQRPQAFSTYKSPGPKFYLSFTMTPAVYPSRAGRMPLEAWCMSFFFRIFLP